MSHAQTFPDIHRYDGKLDPEFVTWLAGWQPRPILTSLQRDTLYKATRVKLGGEIQRAMLDLLIRDPSGNIDTVNKVDGNTMLDLCLIAANKSPDFFQTFDEQLLDMSSGTCPQGRCTRMFQALYSVEIKNFI